ncbi:MAG: SUMF1/EgtB/PvdO family nonheme iron enzyme [Bryobacteraceae bacterium]|nr:SUMF1/EgtB/PvdO family nonheme iron enzyme [Bryobacterales bacterium]NUM99547.1 SUMF1/EgtB/PvdO family nonheme iron enzyme [Bryobacteraceae bacterium]
MPPKTKSTLDCWRSFYLIPVVALFVCAAAHAQQRSMIPIEGRTAEVLDEATKINVTVTTPPFLISPMEVTQAEFESVTGYNPSHHKGARLPVENVTWWEAIRYSNLRSIREGLEPVYDLTNGSWDRSKNGYRLPTNAEWTLALGALPDAAKMTAFANLGSSDTKDAGALLESVKTRGTRNAGSLQPTANGLYDMIGNVWEWVYDYANPTSAVYSAASPSGPGTGVARMVRGGSFASTTSRWARGYRSSIEPDRKSRFTGFRVARNQPAPAAKPGRPAWLSEVLTPPAEIGNSTGKLSALVPEGDRLDTWNENRAELRKKWNGILGSMNLTPPAPAVRVVETFEEPAYSGRLMYLQVEPDYWEKILVMTPHTRVSKPLPVVIVPYYDVDTPAGKDLGGRLFTPLGTRSYAHLAVQQGYIAVAIRWFGESYGEHYAEAVANLKLRHPNVTGLGKWVWDSQRLLDYIYTLPEADHSRIGIIGHSLGGKMALYAGAMDDRITAVVSSEPGIGLSFSNYEDYWYLGEKTRSLPAGTDHHELLAMIAPRPFLLIGGDDSDNAKSWYYINAAKAVYSLLGKPDQIAYLNHHSGHSPTPDSIYKAMEWLKRSFMKEE